MIMQRSTSTKIKTNEMADESSVFIELEDRTTVHHGPHSKSGGNDYGISVTPRDQSPKGSGNLIVKFLDTASASGAVVHNETKIYDDRDRDTRPRFYDGRFDITNIQTILATFGSAGVLALVVKASKEVLIQWLKNKGSRRIKFKVGNFEISAVGAHENEEILEIFEKTIAATATAPKVPKASLHPPLLKGATRRVKSKNNLM